MENLCLICYEYKELSEIITLKCDHKFCWICLNDYIKENLNCKIKCPFENCNEFIRDSQIRRVLSDEDIEQYENICLGEIKKSHKCLLAECNQSVIYTDPDVQYSCENCKLYNCIQCKASHSFTSCSHYQSKSPNTKNRICQEALKNAKKVLNDKKRMDSRKMLLKYDEMDIVPNDSVFTCMFCDSAIGKGDGIKLQNCHHNACKNCLITSIVNGTKIPVSCPNCETPIKDGEIQSILTPDQLLIYQEICRNYVKKYINHFQCQTVDCDGFYELPESMTEFICKKCGIVNCVPCRAVHSNETCDQYQFRLNSNPELSLNEEQIQNGNIMKCLTCGNYLTKVRGCNWIQCPHCSTELCWIRKMLRWGPEGRGDTSGGCRCGVDDINCHPDCEGCMPDNDSMNSRDSEDLLELGVSRFSEYFRESSVSRFSEYLLELSVSRDSEDLLELSVSRNSEGLRESNSS